MRNPKRMKSSMRITQVTYSEQETLSLGERLGRQLRGGEIIALSGELGAGKTCLVKGIAKGLDITEIITSSSFVLASQYQGRLNLHHLDFYRLHSPEDFFSIGFEDYLSADSVVVIEWADRFRQFLPIPYLDIDLFIIDETTRELVFSLKDGNAHLGDIIRHLVGTR